jgi:hypothetical protein
MVLGDDVIDLERQIEIVLVDLAVFATASSPLPHQVLARE